MECRIHLADGPTQPATRSTIYLPIIGGPPLPPVEPRPATPADEFLALLLADGRQRRPLTVCKKLQQSALWRAHGLAHGDPWSHTDSHGIGPNAYVRRAGCVLSVEYSQNGNQLESLVAGTDNVGVAFAALAASRHAEHLFGVAWFEHQTHVGIAMATGGVYGWYWAVHIASCEQV